MNSTSIEPLSKLHPLVIDPYGIGASLYIQSDGYTSSKGNHFPYHSGVVDFFLEQNMTPILQRALQNWGNSLHQVENVESPPESYHYKHIAEFIPDFPAQLKNEIFVDIGCGAGFDIRKMAIKNPDSTFIGMDVGEHVFRNAKRDCALTNLQYLRANALSIPLNNEIADYVVSYGVFHHTSDPQKCIHEAYRILKKNRNGYFYLYTDQAHNKLKKIGVQIESILMKLTSKLSIKNGRRLCWLLSPIILIIFSWPAQILKRLIPKSRIGFSFPLHWGTTPASIVDDLQDRLMSPVNYRFSQKTLFEKFKSAGFKDVFISSTTYGHYIKTTK